MTIKKFYYQLGNTSLNISIYFTFLASIFVLLYIQSQKLEMAIFLLVLLSFFYYMMHLYYLKKANKISQSKEIKFSDKETSVFLINKGNSYIYFFNPIGVATMKFKLQHKINGMYISYFVNNDLIEKVKLTEDHSGAYLFVANNGRTFVRLNMHRKKFSAEIIFPDYTIYVKRKSSYEINFLKDHQLLASVKKGWMPITWIRLFRFNTPVLMFHDRVTEDESYLIHLVLGVFYWR